MLKKKILFILISTLFAASLLAASPNQDGRWQGPTPTISGESSCNFEVVAAALESTQIDTPGTGYGRKDFVKITDTPRTVITVKHKKTREERIIEGQLAFDILWFKDYFRKSNTGTDFYSTWHFDNLGGHTFSTGHPDKKLSICETPDISGVWQCNLGGRYEIRKQGNTVSWEGYSPDFNKYGPNQIKGQWHNTFNGTIQADKVTIKGNYQDQPDGRNRSSGPLVVRIMGPDLIEKVQKGSDTVFGSTRMTRK